MARALVFVFHVQLMLLTTLTSSKAQAAWSEESVKKLERLQGYIKSDTQNLVTLWGGTKRYFQGEGLKGKTESFKLEGFESGLGIYFHDTGEVSKLMVFLPGIFGTHEGQVSPSIINIFEKSGFHTLSVPNFLSRDYIRAKPDYNESNAFSLDPDAALQAVSIIVEKIGKQRVSEIVFVGESLGAHLLGRLAGSLGRFPSVSSKSGKLFFLWPPLDVGKALEAFDRNASSTKQKYEECGYILRLPTFLKSFWWDEKPNGLSREDSACFGAYLFHGTFLKTMGKVYDVFAQTYGKEEEAAPRGFGAFVTKYNPYFEKAIESDSEILKLPHWLEKWRQNGVDIKIVSSTDDFINDKADWNGVQNKFLFDWGEHCAPVSLDGFREVLLKEAE